MTVVCLYTTKHGGKGGSCYGPEWIWALARATRNRLPDSDFRYMSDVCPTPRRVLLEHDWPGWWAKLELFRPGAFNGRVLYLDLDTLVTGDLTDIASYAGEFAILRDFYRPERWQSAVMAWEPNDATAALYHRFRADADAVMRLFRSDQDFIADTWKAHGFTPDALQDLYPGQLVSLKVHALAGQPEGARLVCGHGTPRLSDPAAGWAHERWLAA